MQMLAILLAVTIIAAEAELTPQDIIQFGVANQQCRRENTVDPTTLDRVRAGEMVNDRQFDCFVGCMLQAMNLMDQSGTLNADAAISKVPDADFRDGLVGAIRACANLRGSDRCDTAHRLYQCMQERGVPSMIQG